MRLYHYTCSHGRRAIGDIGEVLPPVLLRPDLSFPPFGILAWFTDLTIPDRGALGLTSTLTRCDRTRYRYRVTADPSSLRPWVAVRHLFPSLLVDMLEETPADPARWWVSDLPVPVRYERRGVER